MNPTQQKILELMLGDAAISTQKIADSIGITKRAIEKNISILKKLGLVERVGSAKAGRWIVKASE